MITANVDIYYIFMLADDIRHYKEIAMKGFAITGPGVENEKAQRASDLAYRTEIKLRTVANILCINFCNIMKAYRVVRRYERKFFTSQY